MKRVLKAFFAVMAIVPIFMIEMVLMALVFLAMFVGLGFSKLGRMIESFGHWLDWAGDGFAGGSIKAGQLLVRFNERFVAWVKL